jgi:hypothetical protein
MNANETRTPKSSSHRRQLLWALLTLTVVAAWPAVSQAGEKRTERAVPRQVAMSASAAPASVQGLVAQQAEEQAYNVVRRHVSALQTCLGRTGAAGKLEVSFNVGPSGRATDIRVEAPDMQGTGIPGCVSAAVGRWPFPASVRARVSFPLLFVQE